MATFLSRLIENAGTILRQPERNISEWLNFGKATPLTGYDASIGGNSGSYLAPFNSPSGSGGVQYTPEQKQLLMEIGNSRTPSVSSMTGTGGLSGGGGGGGGSVPLAPADNSGDLQAQAERERQAKIDRAIARFNVIKEAAQNLKSSATGVFDRTAGELNTNYEKLAGLSKEKLAQALQGLDQTGQGIQNTYGRVIGNAQRAMDSGIMKNRVLARAMGLGGSSNYLWSQGDTRNAGMNATNDANFERAAKLAALDTQRGATKTGFAENDVALEAEKNKFLGDAMAARDKAYQDADFMEKNFGVDSAAAMADADNEWTSALDQIRKYSLENGINTSGNTAVGTFAKNYNALAPIQSTIDNTSGVDSANANIAKIATISPYGTGAAVPVGGDSATQDVGFRKLKKALDPYDYFLNR